MLTENSTDPQVLRSLLHLLIGVPCWADYSVGNTK